ncbi:MAG: flagella basal body P-ring formation protein FlgA [Leptospirales bacterium]
MGHKSGFAKFSLSVLGICAVLLAQSPAGMADTEGALLIPGPGSGVRIDPKVLDGLVRKILGMGPGELVYQNRPRSFRYPDPEGLSGKVLVEGRDRRVVHLALAIRRGKVTEEMFYFDVRRETKHRMITRVFPGQGVPAGDSLDEGGVQSGDTVRIQAVGNGFVITLAGIAQESGRSGDRVTVFNPMSGVRLQGRVIGPDRVRIRVGGNGRATD